MSRPMAMEQDNAAVIGRFYDARARDDLAAVRSMLADGVLWREPRLDSEHTGDLRGAEAVLGMIREARRLTEGTFELRVRAALGHGEQVVALIDWSSTRAGRTLVGREVAVYRVREGRILEATFHPDNLEHDEEFWA